MVANNRLALVIVSVMLADLVGVGVSPVPVVATGQGRNLAVDTTLPSWFTVASPVDRAAGYAVEAPSRVLPAWFLPPNRGPATGLQRPVPGPHHTIRPEAVTVSGPIEINNCDLVTYTVVATNDALTTTNAVITSAMPTGFDPRQRVCSYPFVAPNETVTCTAVFSAGCDAVSGQNETTVGEDGRSDFVVYTEFLVNPGAVTLRKEPAVIEAEVGEVVTWTVYVENTGYGTVSNVAVTDTLGAGLRLVGGITSTMYVSIPVGETRSFGVSARVIGCSDLSNDVEATWGCDGATCQRETASASVDLRTREPHLDFSPPSISVDYCAGQGTYAMPVTNVGAGTAYTPSIAVDFSPLIVTASSAPYSGGAFQIPGAISAGSSYPLTFTLSLPDPRCGMGGRRGAVWYQPVYYDACGNPFTIPLVGGSWTVGGTTPLHSVPNLSQS